MAEQICFSKKSVICHCYVHLLFRTLVIHAQDECHAPKRAEFPIAGPMTPSLPHLRPQDSISTKPKEMVQCTYALKMKPAKV